MKKGFKGVLALGGAAIGSGALYKGAKYISNKRRHKEALKIESETQSLSPKLSELAQNISDVIGREIALETEDSNLPDSWVDYEVDLFLTEFLRKHGAVPGDYKAFLRIK